MASKLRKNVRVHDDIAELLDSYVADGGRPRQQIASTAVFLYFALPGHVRNNVRAFYEAWRNNRGPHFQSDPQPRGEPIVVLDFQTADTHWAFLDLIARELKDDADALRTSMLEHWGDERESPASLPAGSKDRIPPRRTRSTKRSAKKKPATKRRPRQ
jgi:hypothetical protein